MTDHHRKHVLWLFQCRPRWRDGTGLLQAGRVLLSRAQAWIETHVHAPGRLEICFVEEGQYRDAVNDRVFLAPKGHGFIVRPGDVHGNMHVEQEPATLSFLILDLAAKRNIFSSLRASEARYLRALLSGVHPQGFAFSELAVALWQAVMHEIRQLDEMKVGTAHGASMLRVYLEALLAAVCESSLGDVRTRSFQLAQQVDRLLDAYPDKRITLGDLARHFNMSKSCFQARFKSESGLAPIDYVLRRQIDRARERLAQTDDSVTVIAHELGFSSSQNFATSFKRIAGRSPSRYRSDVRHQQGA